MGLESWEPLLRQMGGLFFDKAAGTLKEQLGVHGSTPLLNQPTLYDLATGIERLGEPVLVRARDAETIVLGVCHGRREWRCVVGDHGKSVMAMAITEIQFPDGGNPQGLAECLLERNVRLGSAAWVRVRKQFGFQYFPQATLHQPGVTAAQLHKLAIALTFEASELHAMLGL